MEVFQEEGKGAKGALAATATAASGVRGDTPASWSPGRGPWRALLIGPRGGRTAAKRRPQAESNGTVVAGRPSHAPCPTCSSAPRSAW